jgi:hypothetical protein
MLSAHEPRFHTFSNRPLCAHAKSSPDDDMDAELRLAMQLSMQADEPPRAQLIALPIVPAEPLESEPGVLKLSVRLLRLNLWSIRVLIFHPFDHLTFFALNTWSGRLFVFVSVVVWLLCSSVSWTARAS